MSYRTDADYKAVADTVPVFCAHDKIVDIKKLLPNPRNPNTHPEDQIALLAQIIKQTGWRAPITVSTASGYVVKGHGRLLAAKSLGLKRVPVDYQNYASEAEEYADLIADNRIAELAELDRQQLAEIFAEVDMNDVPIELTGYTDETLAELTEGLAAAIHEEGYDGDDWFETRERYDNGDIDEEDEEYQAFVEKFEAKRTTDDCYTPDIVYDAVADWVASEYGLDRKNFVRPFYPGGDYQAYKYKKNAVVVDNPPFSILSEILTWYMENGVPFFLFAPALTLFSSSSAAAGCALPVGVGVTYENGATVSTSFLTNLEDKGTRIRTAPTLYEAVRCANEENLRALHKELPKYSYPDCVITSAAVQRYSRYGVDFRVSVKESCPISALDAQKEYGKAIYGKGYLISERAAAERAAAERAAAERAAAERAAAHKWELSEREQEIVRGLGMQ